MKFLAIVYKFYKGDVTIDHIEKALQSVAFITKNGQMDEIYDALDMINLMGNSPDTLDSLIKGVSKVQANVDIASSVISLVTFIAFGTAVWRLKVSNAELKTAMEKAGG